jgi:hypothetical protein
VNNKTNEYIGNQYNLRPIDPVKVNDDVLKNPPLYGYRPVRDAWVPKTILKQSALIPLVGLKK